MPEGDMSREGAKARNTDVASHPAELISTVATPKWSELSYSKQYDLVFAQPLDNKTAIPKPNRAAQLKEAGGGMIPFTDVNAVPKTRRFFHRSWTIRDLAILGFQVFIHLAACLAPFTFSWPMLGLFFVMYFISGCLGITLSFHRQLSHKAFVTPKWLEYLLAYCGILAVEGDPMEWVSNHRLHHLHTDTPLDPHSAYEGFWWAHCGWLLDSKVLEKRVGDRGNVGYMRSQLYYRFLEATFPVHVNLQFAALYYFGGLPAVIWGGALRMVWVYHITWFVNSATHLWGDRVYNTGDLSRNNWWVGILAFGEGWHNNHHAFEFSARHGLEWWQFDMTYCVIKALEAVGLAWSVQLPSEKQKARLRINKAD